MPHYPVASMSSESPATVHVYENRSEIFHWDGFFQVVRTWFANRELIGALARREVLERYRGSILGMTWSFVNPLILMLIYTVVFSVVQRMQWIQTRAGFGDFAIMVYSGLIAFNFFSEMMAKSVRVIVNSPNYVKRIAFPVEILPCVLAGGALFHAAASWIILLAGTWLMTGTLHATALLLPVVWIPLVVCALAISLFLSAVGVFIRDTEYIVGLALSILFFLTPIFYSTDRVPQALQWILFINPVAYASENTRKVCILGLAPNWGSWLALLGVGLLFLAVFAGWFRVIKKRFPDVL